jgi:hypothetical protein
MKILLFLLFKTVYATIIEKVMENKPGGSTTCPAISIINPVPLITAIPEVRFPMWIFICTTAVRFIFSSQEM